MLDTVSKVLARTLEMWKVRWALWIAMSVSFWVLTLPLMAAAFISISSIVKVSATTGMPEIGGGALLKILIAMIFLVFACLPAFCIWGASTSAGLAIEDADTIGYGELMKEGFMTTMQMLSIHVVKTLPPVLLMLGSFVLVFGGVFMLFIVIPIQFGSMIWIVVRLAQGAAAEAVCLDKEVAPKEAFAKSRELMEGCLVPALVSFIALAIITSLPLIFAGLFGMGTGAKGVSQLISLALFPAYGFLGVAWYEEVRDEELPFIHGYVPKEA